MAAFNPDGSLDTSWITNPSNSILDMTVDNNNKLYVYSSFSSISGNNINNLAAFNEVGSLDLKFNPNVSSFIYSISDLAINSSNKLIIGGFLDFSGNNVSDKLVVLNTDGTFDTTWIPNPNAWVTALEMDNNGRLYVGVHLLA